MITITNIISQQLSAATPMVDMRLFTHRIILSGVMMAMNFSFDNLFFIIAVPAAISAVMLMLLTVVIRQSASASNTLPRAGVVNE